ncbi:MAG: hypothetical protein ACXABH_15260, partial [Candidatus Thorarchaeota archaeon]
FNLPMGMIYLDEDEWPLDPYILNEHVKAEREWKLLVKRFGGTPPEVDPDVIEFVETKLMEYLEQHYPRDMYDLKRLELERIYMVELQLPALFFLDQVIAGVQAKLKKKEREYNAQEFVEKQHAHEEFVHEQEVLIDIIAPKLVKYFRYYTTEDKMQFPNIGACKDYLRKSTNLDPSFFSRCIDRARHLWLRMKAGKDILDEAFAIVEVPPPMKAGEFIADIDDPFWLKFVRKKFPKLVKPEYFNAYQNYQDKKKGWTSHRKVGKSMKPQRAKGTVTGMFSKIEGAMKREMGYEFERVLARVYNESSMVLDIEPELESFKGAKKGEVDLVAHLTDGQFRIISIKSHNENESIGIKKTSPEVKMLLELQSKGTDSHMVVEGLFEGRFFSVPYDPKTTKKSVRIRDSDLIPWPPDLEKLLSDSSRPDANRLEYPTGGAGGGVGGEEEGRESVRSGEKVTPLEGSSDGLADVPGVAEKAIPPGEPGASAGVEDGVRRVTLGEKKLR